MTKTQGKPKHPATTQERQQVITGAAAGLSENRIAKQIGRSRKLVHDIVGEPEVQRQIVDERAELSKLYRDKARQIVSSIDAADISKATLQQKSISTGILLDKSLLLAGEPTQNVAVLVELAAAVRAQRRMEGLRHVEEYARAHGLPAPPVIEAAPAKAQPAVQELTPARYYPVPLRAPSENG